MKVSPSSSPLPARALYRPKSSCDDIDECTFGIVQKKQSLSTNNWIFGSQVSDCKFSNDEFISHEITINDHFDLNVQSNDLCTILQTVMDLMELLKTLKHKTHSTPIINSTVYVFNSADSAVHQYRKRLHDWVIVWSFQLVPVDGDGKCCFYSLVKSLIFQKDNFLVKIKV